LLSYIVRGL